MRLVQKYGGSSLADAKHVARVAKKISESYHAGNELVVVLSAQGKTTNALIEMAKEVNDAPTDRELDMLLVTGEQQSVALMSLALSQYNCPSISLNAYQAGIYSDGRFGKARITEIDGSRIEEELKTKKVVIVTGFQAVNLNKDYTTLGRGGSDTSAVAIAKVIAADKCEIYSDVDGIYTSDPRLVKTAKRLKEIDYD
ncbi:MAG: aspartate kinase, partial [Erysipelothrix sp.]|nr:aspartate kinase [Erysipelothrix sp.]